MREWSPDITNTMAPLEQGPKTRKIARIPPSYRKALRVLKLFTGDRLAWVATRLNRFLGRSTVTFSYDADMLPDDDRRFRLLKLEAEGVEPEILQGAEDILPRIEYITVDVGFERGLEKQSTLPEVVNFLVSRNFEIVGFAKGRLVVLLKNKEFKA